MSNFQNVYNQKMTDFNKMPQSYNVNTTHPIIDNSQEYLLVEKYVSIHSEDRNIEKYPDSSDFEIEMPEDIINVNSIKLIDWTFPSNYNTFSLLNNNILFAFQIKNPYNPSAFGLSDDYHYKIYEALFLTQNEVYKFIIEEGFYNPDQMIVELTNKMNYVVTKRISDYFVEKGWTDALNQLNENGGYTRFIVVYNTVSQKIWFGNSADEFTTINELSTVINEFSSNLCYGDSKNVPDNSMWGLPGYIGLPRQNLGSTNASNLMNINNVVQTYNGAVVPRFYYGNVTPGDNGFWLVPNSDLSGSTVNWIECPNKINLMGDAYMYLEIDGLNCIDETQPYNESKFNATTNKTNGIVNSSFAKLAIPTTPISQWFDKNSVPFKWYYPPAERIRRLRIKIRYHNGRLVNFGVFNFSFMLQFTIMNPQILRQSKTVIYPNNLRT